MDGKDRKDVERRLIETESVVERCICEETGNEKYTIRGYAALFYKEDTPVESQDLGGFTERIMPGAFDNVLKRGTDVVALYNHDPMYILGRESAGTLRISVDERGLRYEVDAPESQKMVVEAISRGDVRGSSFAFRVKEDGTGDTWSRSVEGKQIREIREVDGLFDVGPVLKPAYQATESFVSKRALDIASAPDQETRAEGDVNLKPTAGMASAAERGLRLHEEGKSGDGLKPETVKRAKKIARREEMNRDWVVEMNAWFKRHASDKKTGWMDAGKETPGAVAWLLWGGDAGAKFSARKVAELEKAGKRSIEDRAESKPAPKSDQIKGSSKNKEGSAKNASGKIKVSDKVKASIKKKVADHNAAMKKAKKPIWTKATSGQLLAVYRRGAGAFSTSHRPGVSRAAWAMARVNAYLYLLKNGSPKNSKYTTDNDLLPSGHPKSSKKRSEVAPDHELREEEISVILYEESLAEDYKRIASKHKLWPKPNPEDKRSEGEEQNLAHCIIYSQDGMCEMFVGEVRDDGFFYPFDDVEEPQEERSEQEEAKDEKSTPDVDADTAIAKMKAASLRSST